MVHQVGRKHSQRVRVLGVTFGLALPAFGLLLFDVGHLGAGLLVINHVAGVFALRWLFYAEAEHVVGLYYGAHG
jgi:hypothetical protein